MARRKGKAARRPKDWHQRYTSGQEVQDTASAPQKYSRRAVKLPSWRPAGTVWNPENMPKISGMVSGLFSAGAVVLHEGTELTCGIAKTFRAPEGFSPLAVGDVVTVALAPSDADKLTDEGFRADGMVIARHPRKTVLCRLQPRSGKRGDEYRAAGVEKVVAANMDAMLIVSSTQRPAFRPALVDRFLIVAERGGLTPLLAVNKIDLSMPDEAMLGVFAELGAPVFRCSAVTGAGLDELRAAMAGGRVVLAGASGVGKSTLVNALVPGASAVVREIRPRDHRGRHTTSSAAVYDLPGGGMIMDTPGVRELGLDMRPRELPWYYAEFAPFAGRCRFRDCTHTHEPSCAVIEALQRGDLLPRRYESYLRVLESLTA